MYKKVWRWEKFLEIEFEQKNGVYFILNIELESGLFALPFLNFSSRQTLRCSR